MGLAACSAETTRSSASAIVGGDADTSTHGVVMLVIHGPDASAGWSDCSGTVVSPHVVVTAAHCLDTSLLGFGPSPVFKIYVGDDVYANPPASDFYAVSKTTMDPAFSPTTIAKTGHDIGVVVTTEALPVVPMPFARVPLDASVVGQAARLVGYGQTDPANPDSDGIRNSGSTTIASLGDLEIVTADALPSGCEGDSGGALLATVGGVETLVGAISHGLALEGCKGASTAERVDLDDSLIEPIIDDADPGFLPSNADAGDDAGPPPPAPPPSGSCSAAPARASGNLFAWLLAAALTAAGRRARRTRARAR